MWDITVGNQFAGVFGIRPGLDLPQAYPYLVSGGGLFPSSFAKFQAAAAFAGLSMLDWEPEQLDHYPTREQVNLGIGGTAAVSSGVVTITGGVLPDDFGTNEVYPRRFYVGDAWYAVASRDSDTQLTLVDTSLNVGAGAAYKYAGWDYRELDPEYAVTGEWQQAHDEFAHALTLIEDDAIANGARVGVYEMGVQIWARVDDIVDDLAAWQAQAAETSSYVTASGFRILDWVRDRNGRYCWSNYPSDEVLTNSGTMSRWRTRNQNIMETLRALNIPNVPLFRGKTLEGTAIPEAFMLEMLDDVQSYQPYEWALWEFDGGVTPEFIEIIENYTRSLPWGGSGSAARPPIERASLSALLTPGTPHICL